MVSEYAGRQTNEYRHVFMLPCLYAFLELDVFVYVDKSHFGLTPCSILNDRSP